MSIGVIVEGGTCFLCPYHMLVACPAANHSICAAMQMLLAGVRTLEATRVLQPQDHRAIAGFAAGHLPLDAAWQAGNG